MCVFVFSFLDFALPVSLRVVQALVKLLFSDNLEKANWLEIFTWNSVDIHYS